MKGEADVGGLRNSAAVSSMVIFEVLRDDIFQVYPRTSLGGYRAQYPDPVTLSQGKRRALIRAIFSFVEGLSYVQRVSLVSSFSDRLDPSVVMALKEQQIEITNAGKVRTKSIKASLMSLVRLAVEQYIECYPGRLSIQCSGSGYEGLVSSVKIRDRLMHPRSEHDLFVKDEEIVRAVDGWFWFSEVCVYMLGAELEALTQSVVDLGGLKVLERESHKNAVKLLEFIKEIKISR
ncbi:hypothetical protein QQL38_09820 [Pseudomonas syringae]|uniref:hypothetical protein n=1 Tax=Pseudomonas syringae TaxID=317 RepID=UPI0020BFD3A5|nr:hypothetical protein [Pseudomonas syringae]MCL6306988.1 hypothetical protein [Pseudomonas syringae]